MKRNTDSIKENHITDEKLFNRFQARRRFVKQGIGLSAYLTAPWLFAQNALGQFGDIKKTAFQVDEPNDYREITNYNNFYELGLGKDDPKDNARHLKNYIAKNGWQVEISGAVGKPGIYDIDDILSPHSFEERVYRFRCVETWSMVIPWVGFPLADLIKRFEPGSDAKFVIFETLYDRKNPLPGQKRPVLDWPYREGLRIDEAMNPLSFMATGLYGKPLPAQNGAPLRLVVPWKYGFKSIKSIVRLHFTDKMPRTSWNLSAPSEYGFYANVNPEVDHPRWSQARERKVGNFLKQPTLPFNGYAQQVAHLYKGMDLVKNF